MKQNYTRQLLKHIGCNFTYHLLCKNVRQKLHFYMETVFCTTEKNKNEEMQLFKKLVNFFFFLITINLREAITKALTSMIAAALLSRCLYKSYKTSLSFFIVFLLGWSSIAWKFTGKPYLQKLSKQEMK